jgi:NAD-dependent deacetylase
LHQRWTGERRARQVGEHVPNTTNKPLARPLIVGPMDFSWVSRVAVLTGAGISTDSGIPDYRGPDGVWTRDPGEMNMFNLRTYLRDAETRKRFWARYVNHAAWHAEPNDAHKALAGLAGTGIAVRVLTQNIDGLHQRAGFPARKVLEMHGSMHHTVCVAC